MLSLLAAIFIFQDCCCANFLERAVLSESIGHCKKVERVFASSFLQSRIDEKAFFKGCIEKIKSTTVGEQFLNRLDVLFQAYSALKGQDLRLLITFSSDDSCFSGRFLSVTDNSAILTFSRFNFEGKKIEEDISNCLFAPINLNLISNTLYHKELGLCTVIQSISEIIECKGKLICSVMDCADPYWMLVAHEMIHLEHFLLQELAKLCSERIISLKPSKLDESFATASQAEITQNLHNLFAKDLSEKDYLSIEPIKAMYDCMNDYKFETLKKMCHELYDTRRYGDNKNITPQKALDLFGKKNALPDPIPVLPELKSREKNISHLWNNLEERETVVGAGMSELILRLNARLPIRYIYQVRGKYFFEDFDTVLQIVQNANSSLEKEKLIAFINSDEHAPYFDTRSFRYLVDEELLPNDLFAEYGRPDDTKQQLQGNIEPPKKSMPKKVLMKMLNAIINDFEADKLESVVRQLCLGNGDNSIRQEIKDILKKETETAIISRVEEHIKTSPGSYDKGIIKELVDLLRPYAEVKKPGGEQKRAGSTGSESSAQRKVLQLPQDLSSLGSHIEIIPTKPNGDCCYEALRINRHDLSEALSQNLANKLVQKHLTEQIAELSENEKELFNKIGNTYQNYIEYFIKKTIDEFNELTTVKEINSRSSTNPIKNYLTLGTGKVIYTSNSDTAVDEEQQGLGVIIASFLRRQIYVATVQDDQLVRIECFSPDDEIPGGVLKSSVVDRDSIWIIVNNGAHIDQALLQK